MMTVEQNLMELLQRPITPLEINGLLSDCAQLEQENPYIQSAFKFLMEYKRYQAEMARNNRPAALKYLKRAIVLSPYSHELLEEYQGLFAQPDAPAKQIALVISCRKYAAKALQLAVQLEAADLEFIIVSGNDTERIDHPRAIQVDAPDNYESLPRKVIAAYTWVYETLGKKVGILKIDDDQTLTDPALLRRKLQTFNDDTYTGVPVLELSHDRCWHWNKCQDPALNRQAYGKAVLRPWAAGGAYYLGAAAVEKLVLWLLRFPGLFEGEYYEDKLVGDTLVFENIALQPLQGYADLGLTLAEQHRFNE